MITSYIIVLCVSAWLVAYGMAQFAKRLVLVLGPWAMVSPALCILLPMTAFLAVVSAPAALLIAVLLLLVIRIVMHTRHYSMGIRIAVMAMVALLVASCVTLPVIAHVPPLAMMGYTFILLLGTVYAADYSAPDAPAVNVGMLLVWLPLLVAPFMGAPSYVALDIAIMASCLLAAAMALPHDADFSPARGPLALMTGWLILQTAAHGAWAPALVSALAYASAIAYGLTRMPRNEPFHAL